MALLKTEENAALITDTQYSLNQLVSVLAVSPILFIFYHYSLLNYDLISLLRVARACD